MDFAKRSMQELWDHHNEAVSARDVGMFLEDFAEDGVLITASRLYRGREEIAQWFQEFMEIGRGAVFDSPGPIFERNVVFIKWNMESSTHTVKGAVDTFVVKDGRFQIVTVDIDAVAK
jgi:hypothetical protein